MTITILASGQSNAHGSSGQGGSFSLNPLVRVWNNQNNVDDLSNLGAGWAIPDRTANPFVLLGNNIFVHLASRLADMLDEEVRLIIVARSSRAISSWTDVSGAMYTRLDAVLDAAGAPSIDLFAWHQGEQDDLDGTTGFYEDAFGELIARLIRDGRLPANAPVLLGEPTETFPDALAAIRRVAGRSSQYAVVPMTDLPQNVDAAHYTGASLAVAGGRYFETLARTDTALGKRVRESLRSNRLRVGGDAFRDKNVRLQLEGNYNSNPAHGDFLIEKEGLAAAFPVFMLSSAATGASASGFSVQRRSRGTLSVPEAVQSGDWLGGFSFRGYSPSGAFVQDGLIAVIVDGTPDTNSVPGALTFWTGKTVIVERARITSDGNFGIGTTAPTTPLHVTGPVRVGQYAKAALPSAATSGAGAMLYVTDEVGGAVLAFSDGANWRRVTDRAIVS